MKTLGQTGYEAYRAQSKGVSLATGAPIPEWADMKTEIREAWEAAAFAVLGSATTTAISHHHHHHHHHPVGNEVVVLGDRIISTPAGLKHD